MPDSEEYNDECCWHSVSLHGVDDLDFYRTQTKKIATTKYRKCCRGVMGPSIAHSSHLFDSILEKSVVWVGSTLLQLPDLCLINVSLLLLTFQITWGWVHTPFQTTELGWVPESEVCTYSSVTRDTTVQLGLWATIQTMLSPLSPLTRMSCLELYKRWRM